MILIFILIFIFIYIYIYIYIYIFKTEKTRHLFKTSNIVTLTNLQRTAVRVRFVRVELLRISKKCLVVSDIFCNISEKKHTMSVYIYIYIYIYYIY